MVIKLRIEGIGFLNRESDFIMKHMIHYPKKDLQNK